VTEGSEGFVNLAFTSDAEGTERYAWEMRSPTSAPTLTWRFQVATSLANRDIQIAYPNLGVIPREYRVYLTDEAAQRKQALRTTTKYTFRSNASGLTQRTFLLEVTRAAGSRLRIANLAVSGGEGRALTSGTRITFSLSQAAQVSVVIRTASGRAVFALPATAVKAGINTAHWDHRSQAGAFVPRGVYLLELTAHNDIGEQVRAVRTVRVR
jgi:hypothetical protein